MTTQKENLYSCDLMGESGIILQGSLGVIAFGVLIC